MIQFISKNKITEERMGVGTQNGSECRRKIQAPDFQADSGFYYYSY